MNGYLIALLVFLAYFSLVYVLRKSKWLERHSMSLYGPFIIWKTRRGREFVGKLASPKRLWNVYGMIALWVCASAMVLIMLLLLWQATIVSRIERPPSPELILGIPGINPIIPVGYGILALVVALVVHELSHGILTRAGGMKLQSMGVLFLVFPVGAFVEPDEKELKSATRKKRSKVYAAGPASNIVLAMVFLALFSGVMMSSVEPSSEGALAVGVVDGSPVSRAGLTPTSVIVAVNGTPVSTADEFDHRLAERPGTAVSVEYIYAGERRTLEGVVDGVVVAYTVKEFAGYEAGLRTGMVLLSVNDTVLRNVEEFSEAMALTRADQIVNVSAMKYDSDSGEWILAGDITSIRLSNKHDYYARYLPEDNDPSYDGKGYLGVGALNLGVDARDTDFYAAFLGNPFEGDRSLGDFSMSWLRLLALPFLDLAPMRSPVTDLYEPSGSLAWMPDSVFWLLANSLYWIFWLNLMVGLTNVLPAVPLDGGYLFRDLVDYLLSKTGKAYTPEQRDRIVGSLTLFLAFVVLGLILWQLIGPAL